MKRIIQGAGALLLGICIFAGVFMGSATNALSAGAGAPIDTPYQYPVVPGTDEWTALTDHVEKLELCQIPEEILSNMTTRALAETVLAYPLLVDMYAWDSTAIGYQVVSAAFNGLAELERRPDGLSALEELEGETGAASGDAAALYLRTLIREMSAAKADADAA